MLLYMV